MDNYSQHDKRFWSLCIEIALKIVMSRRITYAICMYKGICVEQASLSVKELIVVNMHLARYTLQFTLFLFLI